MQGVGRFDLLLNVLVGGINTVDQVDNFLEQLNLRSHNGRVAERFLRTVNRVGQLLLIKHGCRYDLAQTNCIEAFHFNFQILDIAFQMNQLSRSHFQIGEHLVFFENIQSFFRNHSF